MRIVDLADTDVAIGVRTAGFPRISCRILSVLLYIKSTRGGCQHS